MDISFEEADIYVLENVVDSSVTLVEVMAWCHQATSYWHYTATVNLSSLHQHISVSIKTS